MQLFLHCQDVHSVEVSERDSVSKLKTLLEEREGVPAALQVLSSQAGRPLEDDELCGDVLEDGGRVEIAAPLVGGKVHGSLARAGKVRGQTPKIEKMEKKKKKTGRAKRRQQYNKRFVNVVATVGRRRGPNASQPANS